MNISRFLLIDAALVIASTPILFSKGLYKKVPFIRDINNEELLENSSINAPVKEKILVLEEIANVQGSGITFEDLLGNWRFISVWKNNNDSLFSTLLRVFSANLELKKDISIDNPLSFSITVSIQFGIFLIEFLGNAYLEGEQPSLPFFFNLIELKSGSSILFNRSLEEPVKKQKPFFDLIALAESRRWLSARGHGGALLQWFKD